jgi:predicted transcriptional regulator
MPTLAAYAAMLEGIRRREGLRICRAAWLVGVSAREYREIEAGDRTPSLHTYQRISER